MGAVIFDDVQGLALAQAAASSSQCVRRQVGAVVLDQYGTLVSAGANEAPGCEAKCPRASSTAPPYSPYSTGPGSCIAVHAEVRALLRASWGDLRGGTIYVTCDPCTDCAKIICDTPLARLVTPTRQRSMQDYRTVLHVELTGRPPVH